MKLFWGLFLVLALAAGGMLFVRARGGAAGGAGEVRVSTQPAAESAAPGVAGGPGVPDRAARDAEDAQPPALENSAPEVEAAPKTTVPAEPPPAVGDGEAIGAPGATDAQEDTEQAAAPDTTGAPDEPGPAGASADARENAPPSDSPDAAGEPVADAPGEAAPAGEDAGTASGEHENAGAAPGPSAEVASDVAIEPAPEGAREPVVVEAGGLLLDGRHRIVGEGTREKPYVVSWDTLVALEQDYEPKTEGKKEIPEWVKPLDGKHVAITGFIAFPFIAPTADECMVMLNQWDGCCIGVPPTPYDAVEVKLAETLDIQQGVPNYGTVTGVFRTDPYLVNGWLIGLYVMDDAVLSKGGGKNAPGF